MSLMSVVRLDSHSSSKRPSREKVKGAAFHRCPLLLKGALLNHHVLNHFHSQGNDKCWKRENRNLSHPLIQPQG